VDDGGVPGRLLIIGGAADRCCGAGLLERFVELCGGASARIVLVTTATGMPDQVHADYERGLRKTGDGWKVTHEHTSVPFYMDGTARPAFDLRP
jgi:cyanophycinase-like exopeptidase